MLPCTPSSRAAQVVLAPLFAAASLSFWAAVMPIMQQSYWLDFVTRAAHPKDYLGKVSPGRRPWEWGALRLLHVLLVDVFFAVYAVAFVPFLPLAVCFGVPILLLLLAIVFGAMYAPVQILNGK